jgi:CubicO group peptidase (beta-lactamase class C family)
LATLVDEGKLAWDDPVYQRLPGFVMYDPYVSHEMTIRDLLTHAAAWAWAKATCCSGRSPLTRATRSFTNYDS